MVSSPGLHFWGMMVLKIANSYFIVAHNLLYLSPSGSLNAFIPEEKIQNLKCSVILYAGEVGSMFLNANL